MTESQQTHDAHKTLSDLRDHLARHDKPIAFFFGAGTSCAVRVPDPDDRDKTQPIIPAVAELTEICRKEASELGENYEKAWESIEVHCNEIGQDPNVENILSRLRMMLSAVGNTDTLSGLKKGEIETLEESVRETIAKIVTPELGTIPDDHPHRRCPMAGKDITPESR